MSDRLLPSLVVVFGVLAGGFGAWAQRSERPTHSAALPERVARVAFDEGARDVDTGQPVRRVALVRLADFQGGGSEELVEFLATRRGGELGDCYEDEAPHSVLVRLGGEPEVLEAEAMARSCLERELGAWPWPRDARGLLLLELQTALVL